MEIKPGYKLTELGEIPADWEVVSIGEIARFTSGASINVSALHKQSSDFPVPVFGGNGIAGYTSRALTRNQTVIVGRVGQKCGAVYLSDGPTWITDNALYPQRVNRLVDMRFLAMVLDSAKLNDVRNRNDLPLVTQSIVHAVRIALPPEISEQRAIAGAIRDVDELIQALDQQIVKKRNTKQAAMQQLLTGKNRLPGFGGKWMLLNMSEKSSLKARIGWQGLTTAEYQETGDYYLVTGTDFANGRIQWSTCCFVDRVRYVQDKNIQLRQGDILLTKDGTIGKVGFVESLPGPATLNSGVFVIRPKTDAYDPRFFYYILMSHIFDEFLARLQAGSTISHLYQKDFINFRFLAPPLDEQRAIAAILSDMETEIAALEQRRDKTRVIKQGMMQELLTGKTRLIEVQQASLMPA